MIKLFFKYFALTVFCFTAISCTYLKNKINLPDVPPVVENKYSDELKSLVADKSRPYYIVWNSTASQWPNTNDGTVKNVSGKIYINGKFVERFRNGYTSQHLKNVLSGKYSMSIKKGQEIEIYFESISDPSKRTNPVKFVWPWPDTI